MYDSPENTSASTPETDLVFGGGAILEPILNVDDVAEPDPVLQAMEDTIILLRQTLEEKEQSILRSTIAATGYQQQLEKARTQNDHLRKKLTTTLKAHGALAQKLSTVDQTPSLHGRDIPEAEVAKMKEQWRVAQKSLEREYNRVQAELAKTRVALHQSGQELETQTRARRSEAAHASLQIANLNREVESARSAPHSGSGTDGARKRSILRLSASVAITATIVVGAVFFWQSYQGSQARAASAPLLSASETPASIHPASLVMPSGAGLSGSITSRGAFQKSLGRLNNALYGPVGVTPEQILRAVRESNSKTDPGLCNFQWNNGQPALYYDGSHTSLESSLDRCATAVDQFLRHNDPKNLPVARK